MSSPTSDPADYVRRVQGALKAGDTRGALELALEAERAWPSDPEVKLQRALALRVRGDLPGAVAALDAALVLDPYHHLALLSKASLVEKLSGERAAAALYRSALKLVPTAPPPALQPVIAHARQVVARTDAALEGHLRASVGTAEISEAARRRFDEGLAIAAGTARAYVQEPLLLHYPRLPAIPFYDRAMFPWLPELEAASDTIRAELLDALEAAHADFAPYIAFPKGAPVNQWAELNHSRRWSSFFLWRDGARQDRACDLCPKTAETLAALPMADQPGFAPTAMFSALDARTHIPPHTGSTNVRLIVHLPLILPGPARFRVGGETRDWRMGEAWVFDDTIEHEAWNDAGETRVILIFDVWNPFLEPGERALVSELMLARKAFFAG